LFSLSRAIVALGATRATGFISLVLALGAVILDEVPSLIEDVSIVSISYGVPLAIGVVSRDLRRKRG
jgi:hypothetical protein